MLQDDLSIASTPRKLQKSLHSSISRTLGRKLSATLKDAKNQPNDMYVRNKSHPLLYLFISFVALSFIEEHRYASGAFVNTLHCFYGRFEIAFIVSIKL